MAVRSTTASDTARQENTGIITGINTFSLPILAAKNELTYIENYYYTPNGIRTRWGSVQFKESENIDADIEGDIIYTNIFSRDQDDFYYHFIGTDAGFLYFVKFSDITGTRDQTTVADITLGVDYPSTTISLNLQNDNSVVAQIDAIDELQWALLRAPGVATINRTPALDADTTRIQSAVLDNIIYFIDGTGTLYYFTGDLNTYRTLSTVTISKAEFDDATDLIIGIFVYNKRLWLVTQTDKLIASAPGDGTVIDDTDGFYIKLGRIEGMDIEQVVTTNNAAFIGLSNPRIHRSQTKILSGSTTATYRVDDVDTYVGMIANSGTEINESMIVLTQFGFTDVAAYGNTNDRFGLTQKDTISNKVNDEVFANLEVSSVNSTYHTGVSDSIRTWYVCQLSPTKLAVYDVNFSDTTNRKWAFFTFEKAVRSVKSLVNRLFIVFEDNSLCVTDMPFVYKDTGTPYYKRFKGCVFGKSTTQEATDTGFLSVLKKFSDVIITARTPGTEVDIAITPIVDDVYRRELPTGATLSTVSLVPVEGYERILLSDTDITLADEILLSEGAYTVINKVVSDRKYEGKSIQYYVSDILDDDELPVDLDLEVIEMGCRYTYAKLGFDTDSTSS